MSSEGLKDPHPQPSCHHPDRISTSAVSGTGFDCSTSTANMRTGKDACFGTMEEEKWVNLSKCVVNQLFHSTPLSKVDKRTVTVFYISLFFFRSSGILLRLIETDSTRSLRGLFVSPWFSCMQASPSVLAYRSDARIFYPLPGYEIQRLLCYHSGSFEAVV